MRKLLMYFSLMLLSCVVLVSCLSKPKNYLVNVEAGRQIVELVYTQNLVTMDPLHIAFRLNTLLATVERQKAENPGKDITIDNVIVMVKQGESTIPKNLKKALFGDGEVKQSEEAPGVWNITYKLSAIGLGEGERDNKRRGDITIDTGGKLLKDMDIDQLDVWRLWTESGKNAYQILDAAGTQIFCEMRSYTIGRVGASSWKATASMSAFMDDQVEKNRGWYVSYTITQSGGGGEQDYDNTMASVYVFESIDASGILVASNRTATYSATNLTYSPQCSGAFAPHAGSESMTMELIEGEVIPSNRVRVSYGGSVKECTRHFLLVYNGYTYDSRTGEVTGGDS